MIYSAINSPENTFTVPLTCVYAHGSLEDLLQYDIVVTDSLKVYYLYSNIEKGVMPDGMIKTKATNGKETIDVCVFVWKVEDIMRGLIVDKNDNKDLEFAMKVYKEKRKCL